MNKIKQSILAIVIGLVLSAGVSYAAGVWQNPACGPTGCNTDAPINVSTATQNILGTKTISVNNSMGVLNILGGFKVNGFVEMATAKVSSLQITGGYGGSPARGDFLTATDSSGNSKWVGGIPKFGFFQDWTPIGVGSDVIVTHGLGTDKLMIYLEGRNDDNLLYASIHQMNLGTDAGATGNRGAAWRDLTSSSVTIRRSSGDSCQTTVYCWKYFRITIWKINQ